MKIINWLKENKFQTALIALLTVTFIFMSFNNRENLLGTNKAEANVAMADTFTGVQVQEKVVTIFSSKYCPHCHDLKAFLNSDLKKSYPDVKFVIYEVQDEGVIPLFKEYLTKADMDPNFIANPMTFINGEAIVGFNNPEGVGVQIKETIEKHFYNGKEIVKKK